MVADPWNRKLWGVEFRSKGEPFLIGTVWHNLREELYPGEPMRPLLFLTRRAARDWCRANAARYADGKLKSVRVFEKVERL